MAEDLPTSLAGELAAAEALAHLPGFAAASVEVARLPGGSVNRSYSIRTPVGHFVLRFSPAADAWLAPDRSVERALQTLAAAAGLAPRILHADSADRWVITEFVEGLVWSDAHFARAEYLAILGDRLRELHSLAPPVEGRFDLLQALGGYAERLDRARGPGDGPAGEYLEQAALAWQLSGAPERAVAVLHHDLHGSNLIQSRDGRLMLIDWECAVVNDPLLDVACVLSYFEAARAHADVLLRHSGMGAVTPRQLAASVWLFDLHMWLWYRERRMRQVPTRAELAAEGRLAGTVSRGIPSAL
jgi:aminoglycoside phosphotransferase (APT) family kinase protein